ncbi:MULTISPECIES: hypothetical protein [Bradyrhizobium]|uniref:hypothetical protein n=1 Tax=Bradyrhizobium TaxID=374 RepID=UPI001BA9312A|nr:MULTISPECIES: hypothetical protein [Bradyrhizobium]MBR0711402.1 hypothetical protein [Bradyrhizobium liaoningense]MDA9399553.1 hypothetical protein [Bradyrhizobium sp. CCBAU 45389]
MTLQELLLSRQNWSETETIYMVQPWSCSAEVLVSSESPDTADPVFRAGTRYDYFLEGFIARDFLDDIGAPGADVSEAACERLIRYAVNDA